MKKRYILIAVAAIVCVAGIWVGTTRGVDEDDEEAKELERKPLVGLKGVNVTIGEIEPEIEKLGLTKAMLQTEVELELRKYGIKVLSEKERRETVGNPYLYVRVNTIWEPPDAYVIYSTSVELKEAVTILRPPYNTIFMATTWDSGYVGRVGTNNVKTIKDHVIESVREFINDYLAANPSKPSEKWRPRSTVPVEPNK